MGLIECKCKDDDSNDYSDDLGVKVLNPGSKKFGFEDSAVNAVNAKLDDPRDSSYWLQREFDYTGTTEQAYAKKHFTGPNKDIRPLLDYTYHMMYKEERVMLQDRIIKELCGSANEQENLLLPWVIFTAGAMGAGKGYVLKWLKEKGSLPLDQFVTVDPDQIRQQLPEWGGYVENDPLTAAQKTQKEAGHIAEILGYKALRARWNVIFDGSLRDSEWYKLYFAKLRHCFPGIRLMILHIQANREEVLARAEARGRETGRMVPREVLESSMDAVPKSVEILAPYVDVACRVLNLSNQEPQLKREESAVSPPLGIPVTLEYLAHLWTPIDTDGDGQLSKSEVLVAISHGKLTEAVLDTVDVDGDGAISKEELRLASERCYNAGSVRYMNPTASINSDQTEQSFTLARLAKNRTAKWSH